MALLLSWPGPAPYGLTPHLVNASFHLWQVVHKVCCISHITLYKRSVMTMDTERDYLCRLRTAVWLHCIQLPGLLRKRMGYLQAS
jgi:hypothetical protein